jgi:3-phenylpropionate/trans-cinnamate dioxygenase ferredoxin subunit
MAKVKITTTDDVGAGRGKSFSLEGKGIALFNVDGTFYAIEDYCTHAGVALGGGWVDGEVVTCPLHGAQFCLKTGQALTPPAFDDVDSYPVTIEGDDIFVEI